MPRRPMRPVEGVRRAERAKERGEVPGGYGPRQRPRDFSSLSAISPAQMPEPMPGQGEVGPTGFAKPLTRPRPAPAPPETGPNTPMASGTGGPLYAPQAKLQPPSGPQINPGPVPTSVGPGAHGGGFQVPPGRPPVAAPRVSPGATGGGFQVPPSMGAYPKPVQQQGRPTLGMRPPMPRGQGMRPGMPAGMNIGPHLQQLLSRMPQLAPLAYQRLMNQ